MEGTFASSTSKPAALQCQQVGKLSNAEDYLAQLADLVR
jgi:hypothetical protein